ncbi:MAG: phage minor head protein [Candidatus Cloacimonetes bacterium]|nr:phage minor head protein [Candidatus Cloacimonadota bacterium]
MNAEANLSEYDQFMFFAKTAYFKAISNATVRQYQSEGVQKVRIVAYLDDRTSDICRDMHGRVFEIGDYDTNSTGQTKNQLVAPRESFRLGAPTSEIGVELPPYHFNCRTTFEVYFEPSDTAGKVKDLLYNNEQVSNKQIMELIKQGMRAKWSRSYRFKEHALRHGHEMDLKISNYNDSVINNIRDAVREIALTIDPNSFNLMMYCYRPIKDDKCLFTLLDMTNNNIVTHFVRKLKDIDKKLSEAIRLYSVERSKGIMKSVDKAYFKTADLIDKEDIDPYLRDYLKWFFHRSFTETWDFDMIDRYALQRTYKETDCISDEEMQEIYKADKKYIAKYKRGEYNILNSYREEASLFFEWLEGLKAD